MMSGVARARVRSFFPWRMISCPAAKGIRWVKPARYAVSPSCTNFAMASFMLMTLWLSMESRTPFGGDELEAVADDALLLVDAPQLGAHGHADLHVLRVHVGHLADHLRPLVELHDGYGIHAARLLLFRELRWCAARADQRERMHLTASGEADFGELGGHAAVLADALRREVHLAALLALQPDQAVPLGDRPPVHRDGNMGHSSHLTGSLP